MSEQIERLNAASKLVARGKVSRRQFVQLAMATGLTAAVGEVMFTKAARAEPKRGGTFKAGFGAGATSDSLDPATYNNEYTLAMGWGTLGNGLTEVNDKGEITPDLAESFEPSDGAKKWVFKLRNGVTFHNGKTVTADDVVASYRHHMGKDSKSAIKSILAQIQDVKADGNNVIFTLDAGNADFPYYGSDPHLPIMPAQGDKADWESGIRTGPFKLVKFDPGVSTKLVRNENYYRDVWFDAFEMSVILDAAARTAALSSGEIHYMDRCDLATLDLVKATPGVAITEVMGYGHYTTAMNCTVAPFNDVNVRLALKYAIDRKAIREKVFFGHGTDGNDNPIALNVPFAIDPKPRHDYDPDKAKAYLKKAGLDSLKVDLSTAEQVFTGATNAAVLYKESAAKAGIDINVIRESEDGWWDNVWMKKPWIMSLWNGRPTIDMMLSYAYAGDSTSNEAFWSNPKFDQLLKSARSELDTAKRAQMYAEAQQLQQEDGGTVVIVFNDYVSACSDKLAHNTIAGNWDYDGLKIGSRWWFA